MKSSSFLPKGTASQSLSRLCLRFATESILSRMEPTFSYAMEDDRFKQIRFIDGGTYGEVYEVTPQSYLVNMQKPYRLGQQSFARKFVRIFGGISQRRDMQSTMENERRAISKLCGPGAHENIVTAFRDGKLDFGIFYIDMELCHGNLETYIQNYYLATNTCLDPEWIWCIMKQIAAGVTYIHSHREVHRDLKPRNVLYCKTDDTWKIADFGLTTEAASSRFYQTNYARGTAGYRAPELIRNEQPNFNNKVDIWSMGCILVELASGSKAFNTDLDVVEYAQSERQLELNFPSRQEVYTAVQSMLDKNPSQRPRAMELYSEFAQKHSSLLYAPRITSSMSPLDIGSLVADLNNCKMFVTSQSSFCAISRDVYLARMDSSQFIKGESINIIDTELGTSHILYSDDINDIKCISFGCINSGAILFSAIGRAGIIVVWDARTGYQLTRTGAGVEGVESMAFNHSGDFLALGTCYGIIQINSVYGYQQSFRLAYPMSSAVISIKYHQDNTRICALSTRMIRVFSLITGAILHELYVDKPNEMFTKIQLSRSSLIAEQIATGLIELEFDSRRVQIPIAGGCKCWAVSPCGSWMVVTDSHSKIHWLSRTSEGYEQNDTQLEAQFIWFSGRKCFVLTESKMWTMDFERLRNSRN